MVECNESYGTGARTIIILPVRTAIYIEKAPTRLVDGSIDYNTKIIIAVVAIYLGVPKGFVLLAELHFLRRNPFTAPFFPPHSM